MSRVDIEGEDTPAGDDDASETHSADDASPLPYRGEHEGEPIPDLSRIPKDRWVDALRPSSPRVRRHAISTVTTFDDVAPACQAVAWLAFEDEQRRAEALRRSAPPPSPTGLAKARGRRMRQVNFRLTPAEYQDLRSVAFDYGVTATQLARMLTIRGVRRARDDG